MKNEWTHLAPQGMATNPHPEFGGIIDYRLNDGRWFVIANDDAIPSAEDFASKEEAFAHLKAEIARVAKTRSQYR